MQEKLENDDHHHWHSMKKGSIASSGKHCPFFMLSTPTSYSHSLGGFWNKYPICILSGFWDFLVRRELKMLIRTLQQIVKFENCDRHLEYITYWSFISAFPQKSWIHQTCSCPFVRYFCTLVWDDITIICWWKLSKQTSYWSKRGFFLS